MSRKYKFGNKEGLYFVSFATVYWMYVFVRDVYCNVLTENLAYSMNSKGLGLYCWCIMPSHVHLIFRAKSIIQMKCWAGLRNILLRLCVNRSRKILESRREWMLWLMERAAAKDSSVSGFKFWQHHNQPILLWSKEVIKQKVDYIHRNPVVAGFVAEPEHWRYSSATDYSGMKGLIAIELLW